MAMRRFLDTPELVEATPEQFRNGLDRFEVRAVCLVNSPKAGAAQSGPPSRLVSTRRSAATTTSCGSGPLPGRTHPAAEGPMSGDPISHSRGASAFFRLRLKCEGPTPGGRMSARSWRADSNRGPADYEAQARHFARFLSVALCVALALVPHELTRRYDMARWKPGRASSRSMYAARCGRFSSRPIARATATV